MELEELAEPQWLDAADDQTISCNSQLSEAVAADWLGVGCEEEPAWVDAYEF